MLNSFDGTLLSEKKKFGGHNTIQSMDRDNPSQGGVGEPKFLNYEMKSCCMFPWTWSIWTMSNTKFNFIAQLIIFKLKYNQRDILTKYLAE